MKKTMMDYICETPNILEKNIDNYMSLTDPLFNEIGDQSYKNLILIASGSSYNACYAARQFILEATDLTVSVIPPYTFQYYNHKISNDDLVFVVSQSGMSTNAIDALKTLQSMNYKTICLTGHKEADVCQYSDVIVEYGVGEELVGYVTKGVTTLTLFLMLFALRYSNQTSLLDIFQRISYHNNQMIHLSQQFIKKHYKAFSSMHQCYLCGAGASYGVALEGALKIGETLHIPSHAYEVEEYIHGPNLQLNPSYTVIFFDEKKEASERVKQIYLATREVTDRCFLISHFISIPNDDHVLNINDKFLASISPLVYLPFVQILAYTISTDLNTVNQHPLMKDFKKIASAKTMNYVNYDEDE